VTLISPSSPSASCSVSFQYKTSWSSSWKNRHLSTSASQRNKQTKRKFKATYHASSVRVRTRGRITVINSTSEATLASLQSANAPLSPTKFHSGHSCHATSAFSPTGGAMTAEHVACSACGLARYAVHAVLPQLPGRTRPRAAVGAGSKFRATTTACRQDGPTAVEYRRHYCHTRTRPWATLQSLLCAILFSILWCSQGVVAHGGYVARFVAVGSELVFDRSEPPAMPLHLHARQDSASSLPTGIPAPTSSNQSAASSTTSGPLSTDTPTQTTALPSLFDSTLGNNFTTQSCPNFFQSFLSNTTFQHCLPLSLLLQVCHCVRLLLSVN